MKKVYLVRHGQTQWNVEMRVQGYLDSSLTDTGIRQAKNLSAYLKKQEAGIDCIYSSSSGRAYQTAKLITENINIPIYKNDSLKEINLGIWEGREKTEIEKRYPAELHNFWNEPAKFKIDGGEDFFELQDRAVETFYRIVKEEKNKNIMIVSHGAFIRTLLVYLRKEHINKMWEPKINNCSCTVIGGEVDSEFEILEIFSVGDENCSWCKTV